MHNTKFFYNCLLASLLPIFYALFINISIYLPFWMKLNNKIKNYDQYFDNVNNENDKSNNSM